MERKSQIIGWDDSEKGNSNLIVTETGKKNTTI